MVHVPSLGACELSDADRFHALTKATRKAALQGRSCNRMSWRPSPPNSLPVARTARPYSLASEGDR
jgi:hypothetical protein